MLSEYIVHTTDLLKVCMDAQMFSKDTDVVTLMLPSLCTHLVFLYISDYTIASKNCVNTTLVKNTFEQ